MQKARNELYRHFDAEGVLLYIGISKCAIGRLHGHNNAEWRDRIATLTIEAFPTRRSLERAERKAIMAEKPLFNRSIPRPRKRKAKPPENPQLAPAVTESRKGPRRLGYSCVAKCHLDREIDRLRRAGVPDDLMFIDIVDEGGADQPRLTTLLKTAQHRGTTIYCNWKEDFRDHMELLQERGVRLRNAPFARSVFA